MEKSQDIAGSHIVFDIPLKGTRTYIHSTNMLSQFIKRFSLDGPIKIEFRRMIHHPIYLSEDSPDHADRAGKFSFLDGDTWKTYGIFIDQSRAITGHLPDNEPEIQAASAIGDDTATGGIDRPANFIDTIVALNKVLVGRHSPGRKAIFSQMTLDAIPKGGTVGVNLVKKLGTKIFMSDVVWNGDKIGSLTFMAV